MVPGHDITQRLHLAKGGDRAALDEVFSLIYAELHGLAEGQRRRWSGDLTMDTTALVHEAYLKLVGLDEPNWQNRGHFFAVAATAMRHLLVNYAQRRKAAKRGGGIEPLPLDDFNPVLEEAADEVIALHESLERLAAVSPRQVGVVEARFYLGLSIDETAQALEISPATVKRDWQMASAWLYRDIQATLP